MHFQLNDPGGGLYLSPCSLFVRCVQCRPTQWLQQRGGLAFRSTQPEPIFGPWIGQDTRSACCSFHFVSMPYSRAWLSFSLGLPIRTPSLLEGSTSAAFAAPAAIFFLLASSFSDYEYLSFMGRNPQSLSAWAGECWICFASCLWTLVSLA